MGDREVDQELVARAQRGDKRAYELLVADPGGRLTVSEIAYQVGFKNVSHFSRSFSRQFGIAPRDARQLARPSDLTGVTTARQRLVMRRSGDVAPDGAFPPPWRNPAREGGVPA